MKKIVMRTCSFILMLTMVTSMLACTKKEASDGQKDEKYTIQVMVSPTKVIKKSSETPIGKVILDKFNIEFEYIPFSGDAQENQSLLLATGDYPEIMRLEGNDMVNKYASAGALVCLDDYIENSTNFKKLYEEQIPYWRAASPDGKLYHYETSLPQSVDTALEVNDIMVRSDLLEQQGYPTLVTEDDWFNFLKKAMEDNPKTNGQNTVGLTMAMAESWGPALATAFVEKGGDCNDQATNDAVLWNQVEQKWVATWKNKDAIQNYRFFNRLYNAGLLDPDCFTDTNDQVQEKADMGRAIAIFYSTWNGTTANPTLTAAGHPEMQYIQMPIVSNDQWASGEKRQIRLETTRPFDSVAITKNAKHPERIFELLDWIASEEGQVLLQSGIEGTHYTVEDGKRVPTKEYIDGIVNDANYVETQGFGYANGQLFLLGASRSVGSDGVAYNFQLDKNYKDEIFLSDWEKKIYSKLGWKNSTSFWSEQGVAAPTGIAPTCSLDTQSDIGKLNEKFKLWRAAAGAELITADDFDKTLEQLNEEYDKNEFDTIVDAYNNVLSTNQKNLEQYLQ